MPARFRHGTGRVLGAAAVAVLAAGGGAASAQDDSAPDQAPVCPPSVDTPAEGWVCAQLVLNTPATEPSDAEVGRWEGTLAVDGRRGAADAIVFSDASVEAKVAQIFARALQRAPEPEAIEHWSAVIVEHRSELAFEHAVFSSPEYIRRFDTAAAFVADQYDHYLGRAPSDAEVEAWTEAMGVHAVSHHSITRAVATSPEAGHVRAERLYWSWVRRAPDPGGLAHWGEVAAERGLFHAIVEISTSDEVFETLGAHGMCLASGDC